MPYKNSHSIPGVSHVQWLWEILMAGYLSRSEDLTELELKGLPWSLKKQYGPLTPLLAPLYLEKHPAH